MSTRIDLKESIFEVVFNISERNSDANRILFDTIRYQSYIDPENSFGKYAGLIFFDEIDVYGSDIATFFYRRLKGDYVTIFILLRSLEFGFVQVNEINKWFEEEDAITPNRLVNLKRMVIERVPSFVQFH